MDDKTKQEVRDMVERGTVRVTFELPKPTLGDIWICECGIEYGTDAPDNCEQCGEQLENSGHLITVLAGEDCGCRYRECGCESRSCLTGGVVYDLCPLHEHAGKLLTALEALLTSHGHRAMCVPSCPECEQARTAIAAAKG